MSDPAPDAPQPGGHFDVDSHLADVHAALADAGAASGLPAWLTALALVAAFAGGSLLIGSAGGFRPDALDPDFASYSPGAGGGPAAPDPIKLGRRLYLNNCATCHQPTGLGAPGQYPHLAGSKWVQGPANRIIALVLNGLQGPWDQDGTLYNGNMQAWKNDLTDEQLSQILTYIRQEWGNKAAPISPELVARGRAAFGARTKQWSAADLDAVPAEPWESAATPAPPPAPAAPAAN